MTSNTNGNQTGFANQLWNRQLVQMKTTIFE